MGVRAEGQPIPNPLEHLADTGRGVATWAGRHWKQLSLAVAALGTAGYLLITHDRSPQNPPTEPAKASDSFNPSEKDFGVAVVPLPTFPPEPPATPEPPPTAKIDPTPTSEVKPSVNPEETKPCRIVPDEFCTGAKLIETTNARGETVTLIGLRLRAGTEIFSPKNGQATRVEIKQPASVKGFQTTILDPNSVGSGSVYITGDLEFDAFSTTNVKEGSIIARVGDRGITNYGNYNVIVRAGRFDETLGRAVSDINLLKRLFPAAFTKPHERVEPQGSGQYFGGNIYRNSRP